MNFFSEFIINALFPRCCLGCGRLGVYVCPDCAAKLTHIKSDICPYCRAPSYLGLTHPVCVRRYGLDGVKSIYRYTPLLRSIIKNIKYRGVYESISDLMSGIFQASDELARFYSLLSPQPVIVPVPLHPARYRLRGFNQSRFIADIWHNHLTFAVDDASVVRIKNTPPQARLGSAKKRYENVRSAFVIKKNTDAIVGSNYIIVDDVWTTGSTLKEICKVMKRAGAKKVFALCIAH